MPPKPNKPQKPKPEPSARGPEPDMRKLLKFRGTPKEQADKARRRARVARSAETGLTFNEKLKRAQALEEARTKRRVAEPKKPKEPKARNIMEFSHLGVVWAMKFPERAGLFELLRPYTAKLAGAHAQVRIRTGLMLGLTGVQIKEAGKPGNVRYSLTYEYPALRSFFTGRPKTRTVIFDGRGNVISK